MVLFQSLLPELQQLNLLNTSLNEVDLKALCLACNDDTKTLPKLKSLSLTLPNQRNANTLREHLFALPWLTLENIYICCQAGHGDMGEWLGPPLKQNKLPNLKYLGIQYESVGRTVRLGHLSLKTIHNLESLVLWNCLPHDDSLIVLMNASRLVIQSCSGLSGYLSVLLHAGFLNLYTLVLSDCKLNSDDLSNLALACVEGRLPELRHMDITRNAMNCSEFMHLFDSFCSWNVLLSLDIRGTLLHTPDVVEFMTKVKESGLLGNLKEIGIDNYANVNTSWVNLTMLCLSQFTLDSLRNLINNVDRGYMPALDMICIEKFETYNGKIVRSLSERNINCHKMFAPFDDPFGTIKCYCQMK